MPDTTNYININKDLDLTEEEQKDLPLKLANYLAENKNEPSQHILTETVSTQSLEDFLNQEDTYVNTICAVCDVPRVTEQKSLSLLQKSRNYFFKPVIRPLFFTTYGAAESTSDVYDVVDGMFMISKADYYSEDKMHNVAVAGRIAAKRLMSYYDVMSNLNPVEDIAETAGYSAVEKSEDLNIRKGYQLDSTEEEDMKREREQNDLSITAAYRSDDEYNDLEPSSDLDNDSRYIVMRTR